MMDVVVALLVAQSALKLLRGPRLFKWCCHLSNKALLANKALLVSTARDGRVRAVRSEARTIHTEG